jgi:predicted DNA-binding ArsR family transcriptional regulator
MRDLNEIECFVKAVSRRSAALRHNGMKSELAVDQR